MSVAVMERLSAPVRGVVSSVRRSRQMLTMVRVHACWYWCRSALPFIGVEGEVDGFVDVDHEVASGESAAHEGSEVGGGHLVQVDVGERVLQQVCVGHDAALQLSAQVAAGGDGLQSFGFVCGVAAHEQEDGECASLEEGSAAAQCLPGFDVVGEAEGACGAPGLDDALDAFDAGACAVCEAVAHGQAVGADEVGDVVVEVEHGVGVIYVYMCVS